MRTASILLCVLALMVSTVNASFILNGSFETLDTNPGSPVFTNWSDIGAATALIPISGSYSAKMVQMGGGNLLQNLSTPQSIFTVEFDLALKDPGNTTTRSFQLNLYHSAGGANLGNINLRIVRGSSSTVGTLQVYNGAAWVAVVSDAVTFSESESVLSVNHVLIAGNYSSSPSYSFSVTDSGGTKRTALGLTAWQNIAPVAGNGLSTTKFDGSNIVAGSFYVIDNVNVIQAPSAQNPSPDNGATDQDATGLFLTWERGDDPNHLGQPNPAVTGYYVYIKKYDVSSNPGEPNFVGVTPVSLSGTQYPASSPGIAYGIDQVVYWRVDESKNGSSAIDPNTITGNTWYLTTTSSNPEIITQPQDVEIFEGETAVFTIEAGGVYPITSYKWYDSDDVLVGSGATLTITNAAIEDSNSFYCVVTNNQNKSTQSDSASLYVKGLLAQYHFEDNLQDSADSHHGVGMNVDPNATPTISYTTGVSGKAVQLDRVSYVKLPQGAYPNSFMGLANGTIVCWVKTTSAGTNTVIAAYNVGLTTAYNLSIRDPNTVFLYIRSEGNLVSQIQVTAPGIKDGQWHHLAATYELDGNAIVYMDGEQLASTAAIPASAQFTPWTYSLPIGAGDVRGAITELFEGAIDELILYNYVKTSKEILDMYNAIAEPDKSLCLNAYASVFDLAGPGGVGAAYKDCKVNLYDFAAMASFWLDCGLYPPTPECP